MSEVASTTLDGLKASFPFPSMRPSQEKALEVIASSYDERKPFMALDLPTGVGKSPTGMAAAIWSANTDTEVSGVQGSGAHYLTSQNSLSKQLVNDFGDNGLVRIQGRSNYRCETHRVSCDDGAMINGGKTCEGCPYREAKNLYTYGKLGVTNYTYYLTETRYQKELTPREYLICDEAHNIEKEILSLADITITQHRCDELSAGRLPRFDADDGHLVRNWVSQKFLPMLAGGIGKLNDEIDSCKESGSKAPVAVQKRLYSLQQLHGNLTSYLEEGKDEWLAWTDSETGHLMIRPLSAAGYAQQFLFNGSPNILLMSATILDFATFRRNLGIPKDSMRSFAVPSEFPVKNRRIVYWPVGSMGYKSIEATLPRLAQRVEAILGKYADKKGLVHTNSFRINTYLQNALRSTPHRNRILTHSSGPGSREDAIRQHYESEGPTVLMSPSMTEGLDLKGDLGRVNLITKLPYALLNPYNRMRMERDPKWYQLQAAVALVQASGRCVRSEDDYALTVILDADFGRFLSQNQDILPKWWLDSIEFK
jgi:ATP-dependent DNA helicase DinG